MSTNYSIFLALKDKVFDSPPHITYHTATALFFRWSVFISKVFIGSCVHNIFEIVVWFFFIIDINQFVNFTSKLS